MIINPAQYGGKIRTTSCQLSCIAAAWMYHVPWGALLVEPTLTGGIDSKPFESHIPERSERFDEDIFPERNPNVIKDDVPKYKIVQVQVSCRFDGFSVLSKP